MRALVMMMGLVAMTGAAQAAPVFEDPRALIEYVYEPYFSDAFPDHPTEVYSPTLKQLWDTMVRRSEASDMPIVDFDPAINGQDYELGEFVVADPVVEGDSALVVVSFTNFGEAQELRFELVRRAEGWKIDDIESVGASVWRLSELLAADPLLN